jgi:hypothetical protein
VDGPRHTRKAIRFPLEAPIVFWWADSGSEKKGEGRTYDINEMGTFVLSGTRPPVGTQISFKIFLPVLPGSESQTRVEAVGQVLRVEQARGLKGRDGFAILARRILLRVNDIHESSGKVATK